MVVIPSNSLQFAVLYMLLFLKQLFLHILTKFKCSEVKNVMCIFAFKCIHCVFYWSMAQTAVRNEKVMLTTNILALETQPGKLLKVTCDTSPEKFASAAQNGDVTRTAGHLVSMIVTNKGIGNTPLALLGNHIKTALLQMQASAEAKLTPGKLRSLIWYTKKIIKNQTAKYTQAIQLKQSYVNDPCLIVL